MSKWKTSKIRKQRQKFSNEEDNLIIKLVEEYGFKQLSKYENLFPNRNAKQIRERYHLYFDPTLTQSPFTLQEDELLLKSYFDFHGKWCLIAKLFPGRTDVCLKYHYRKLLKRQRKS
jgi:hypothetical protein